MSRLTPEEQHLAEIALETDALYDQMQELRKKLGRWANDNDDPDNVDRSYKLEVAVGSLEMAVGAVQNAAQTLAELTKEPGAQ